MIALLLLAAVLAGAGGALILDGDTVAGILLIAAGVVAGFAYSTSSLWRRKR